MSNAPDCHKTGNFLEFSQKSWAKPSLRSQLSRLWQALSVNRMTTLWPNLQRKPRKGQQLAKFYDFILPDNFDFDKNKINPKLNFEIVLNAIWY